MQHLARSEAAPCVAANEAAIALSGHIDLMFANGGVCMARLGRTLAAIAMYARGLKLHPASFLLNLNYGTELYNAGQQRDALKYYLRAREATFANSVFQVA